MPKWEFQYRPVDTTTWKALPSVEYPEWELENLADMPLQKFSGQAKIFFRDSSLKVSALRVEQQASEQELE